MAADYPEDVVKAAREAYAQLWDDAGFKHVAKRTRMGEYDDGEGVQSACIAIMAERQRCAEKASSLIDQEPLSDFDSGWTGAAESIKQAILGQQEPKA